MLMRELCRPWVVLAAILLTTAIACTVLTGHEVSRTLGGQNYQAMIQRDGYASSRSALQWKYGELPKGTHNAATDVLGAAHAHRGWGFRTPPPERKNQLWGDDEYGLLMPEPGERLSPRQSEYLAEYIAHNTDSINLLLALDGTRPARYPIHLVFALSHPEHSDHLELIRIARELMSWAAVHAMYEKDTDRVVACIRAQYFIARTLDKEPLLESQLAREACLAEMTRSVERALNAVNFSDAQLRTLQQLCGDGPSDVHQGIPLGIMGNAVLTMDMIQRDDLAHEQIYDLRDLVQYVGLSKIDLHAYTHDMILAAELGYYSPELALAGNFRGAMPWMSLYRTPFSTLFGSSYFSYQLGNVSNRVVRDHLVITAIAVERYRLEHNRLPDALEALVPEFLDEVPRDFYEDFGKRYRLAEKRFQEQHGRAPYDIIELGSAGVDQLFEKRSVKYRQEEDGYLIYSAGRDEKDDGGINFRVDEQGRERRNEDMVLRVRR